MRDPFTSSLAYRRQYVSDRKWSGLAFVVIAGGVAYATCGWLKLVAVLPLLLGVVLLSSGFSRALRRMDASSGRPKPGPPW